MRSPRPSIAPVLVAGLLVLALLLVGPEQVTAGTPVQGQIVTDTTWTLAGSPYWVEGDVVVLSTANLTLEPGVRVLFDGPFAIYVEGELFAVGSPASVISFTSNLSKPSPGAWRGLQVNATGRALIHHTDVAYSLFGIGLDGSPAAEIAFSNISRNLRSGISITNWSSGHVIEHNLIHNNSDGIHIDAGSSVSILSNTIVFNEVGIDCQFCYDISVEGNAISHNAYRAVYLYGPIHGSGNSIRGNTIESNSHLGWTWEWICDATYSPVVQAAVYSTGGNEITGNIVTGNHGTGVAIDCGGTDYFEGNVVTHNDIGLATHSFKHGMYFSSGVTAHNNLFKENTVGVGILAHDWMPGSTLLYNNDFIDNDLHADDEYGVRWHDDSTKRGNHWSDHGCADWDRDWICDYEYVISYDPWVADYYPLMFPAVWRGPPEGQWPVADPGGPYFGVVAKPITFHGEGSYDPDGELVRYYWDFGDGDFGGGPTPEWAYWWPGEFSVLLVVWDDDYMWGMCNTTATITEGLSLPHTPQPNGPVSGTPVPVPGP
jgi:nitrous oxidase accessory protein NosD